MPLCFIMTSSSGWSQRHEKDVVCFTLAAIWRSSRSRGFRRCILHLKLQPMIDRRCVLIQLSQFRLLCKKWKNMLRTCLTHWETRNLSNEASVQNVEYLCPQSSLFHVVPRISQSLGKHLRLCAPEPFEPLALEGDVFVAQEPFPWDSQM